MKQFLDEVLIANKNNYKSLVFNIYEDEEHYTMEAIFDENVEIRRERPIIIGDTNVDYKFILENVKNNLLSFYKKYDNKLSNLDDISYGFVDGDLYYIKKKTIKEKSYKKFTFEDIKEFSPIKIGAWISVYLKKEVKDAMKIPYTASFPKMTEEELNKWIKILVENFDYEKYNKQ